MGVVTEENNGDHKPGAASCCAGGEYHLTQDISVLSARRAVGAREGRMEREEEGWAEGREMGRQGRGVQGRESTPVTGRRVSSRRVHAQSPVLGVNPSQGPTYVHVAAVVETSSRLRQPTHHRPHVAVACQTQPTGATADCVVQQHPLGAVFTLTYIALLNSLSDHHSVRQHLFVLDNDDV